MTCVLMMFRPLLEFKQVRLTKGLFSVHVYTDFLLSSAYLAISLTIKKILENEALISMQDDDQFKSSMNFYGLNES